MKLNTISNVVFDGLEGFEDKYGYKNNMLVINPCYANEIQNELDSLVLIGKLNGRLRIWYSFSDKGEYSHVHYGFYDARGTLIVHLFFQGLFSVNLKQYELRMLEFTYSNIYLENKEVTTIPHEMPKLLRKARSYFLKNA